MIHVGFENNMEIDTCLYALTVSNKEVSERRECSHSLLPKSWILISISRSEIKKNSPSSQKKLKKAGNGGTAKRI